MIATARGAGSSEAWYLYNKDTRGSTSSLIDDSGTVAAAYTYDEFGNTTTRAGTDFDNELCYTGQVYDKETGLYYYNARFHDPEDGRFLTQDTYRGEFKAPKTWNLYAYCANNPVNYVDPSGHVFFGFWSKKQHYFAYNQNAPQKYFGYYDIYDTAANLFGMNIGHFKRQTNKWKIEFWKGQYGEMHGFSASSGCEIGLYYKSGHLWKCAYQKNRRLRMRMSLYKQGFSKKMFTRDSKTSTKQGKAWWLTAFQPFMYMPGKSTAPPEKLRMTGTIWFSSSNKYDAEMKKLSGKMGSNKTYTTDWGKFKVRKTNDWKKKIFSWRCLKR